MHPDHITTISLTAAFIAGVTGSVHCLAMCGGMAGALGMRARVLATDARAAFMYAALYQIGRIGGYALTGLVFGALGAAALGIVDIAQLTAIVRIASGLFIALVGVRLLLRWNPLAWIERGGARFWSRLKPLAQRTARDVSSSRALALGFLWGWLPCGLVYSMLLLAAMSGSGLTGGGIMLAFGVGTLPSMLTSTMLSTQLQRVMWKRWPKVVSGTLLVVFGLWMIVAALQMRSGHVH